jgi:hypothetical protein
MKKNKAAGLYKKPEIKWYRGEDLNLHGVAPTST